MQPFELPKTDQSIVAKASSLYSPSAGMTLSGLPTDTPSVWLRIACAPMVWSVFMTSVILPKVG